MSAQSAPAGTPGVLAPEDRARADLYALISRLFFAAPDAGLLAAIAGADEIAVEAENISLAQCWKSLTLAAAEADADAVQAEYDSVFVGTGKAEITPYASHYLADSMKESVLARLRTDLAAMGLERASGTAEFEDHFAALCEVMRYLIQIGSDNAALHEQKTFFMRYLVPCFVKFCEIVVASPATGFYKPVARFTRAFLEVEKESFEMA